MSHYWTFTSGLTEEKCALFSTYVPQLLCGICSFYLGIFCSCCLCGANIFLSSSVELFSYLSQVYFFFTRKQNPHWSSLGAPMGKSWISLLIYVIGKQETGWNWSKVSLLSAQHFKWMCNSITNHWWLGFFHSRYINTVQYIIDLCHDWWYCAFYFNPAGRWSIETPSETLPRTHVYQYAVLHGNKKFWLWDGRRGETENNAWGMCLYASLFS